MAELAVTGGALILAVSDFERSFGFYTERLGFAVKKRFDDPSFAILRNGPMQLALIEEGHPSEEDRPGIVPTALADRQRPPAYLVLWVEDCPAAYEALAAEGVEFLSPPVSPPWGGSRCYAVDPDGYLVEIEQLAG